MRRTRKEREAEKRAFRNMSKAEKIDHIYTYYKLPIFTVCVILAILLQAGIRALTKKDTVLYLAYANVSFGDTLHEELTGGYMSYSGTDVKKNEFIEFPDLYLSDDASAENHQYAYASKIKVLGAISARQMDVVFLNKEAYDLMSTSGFLMELKGIKGLDALLYQRMEPYITENTVIIEDNSVDYDLGKASEYHAVTEEHTNALNVSSFPMFRRAVMDDDVYVAVIANSPRLPAVLSYLEYLLSAD